MISGRGGYLFISGTLSCTTVITRAVSQDTAIPYMMARAVFHLSVGKGEAKVVLGDLSSTWQLLHRLFLVASSLLTLLLLPRDPSSELVEEMEFVLATIGLLVEDGDKSTVARL